MIQPTYFTIASANYLPYVRTLYDSLRAAGVDADFTLFLVDEVDGRFRPEDLPFDVVEARSIGIPTFWDMAFRYSIMELNTAIKPSCFQYLFEKRRVDSAIYLDPDIFVLRPLDHIENGLASGAALVLTPHILEPIADDLDPDDFRILQTGVYNLGFCAMRKTEQTETLLRWWADRLRADCIVAVDKGIFVDQTYMNLAPCFVRDTLILRHPGYNAAYWNLMHRPVTRAEDGGYCAGGAPLHFFHFSGVVPDDRTVFSKHQNRFWVETIGPDLGGLLSEYLAALSANADVGGARAFDFPYTYGKLSNGEKISEQMRRVYAQARTPSTAAREQVFAADYSLYNEPHASGRSAAGAPITRLMHEIWKSRWDLRDAFSLSNPAGRAQFMEWYSTQAPLEHDIPLACRLVAETPAHARSDRKRYRLGMSDADVAKLRPKPGKVLVGEADLASAVAERLEARNPSLPAGVALFGYLRAESGVGAGARRARSAIEAAGIPYTAHLVPADEFNGDLDPCGPLSETPSPYSVALFHVNADRTPGLFRSLPAQAWEGRYRIGYWAWELAKFPAQWRAAIECVDEVWCPSRFVADAVASAGARTVAVMPHPIPPHTGVGARARARYAVPPDASLILSTFDFHSYTARKNPSAAIAAYRDAFADRGEAAPYFIVKAHGAQRDPAASRRVRAALEALPNARFVEEVLSDTEMADIQAAAGVFLSLHRAEGFGLNIAECMAAGSVVIATNYSGNTDFMTVENSVPIGYVLKPVHAGEYPMAHGQVWAEPNHDEAVDALRRLVDHEARRASLGAAARETMRTAYSPEAVGQLMGARIRKIWASG